MTNEEIKRTQLAAIDAALKLDMVEKELMNSVPEELKARYLAALEADIEAQEDWDDCISNLKKGKSK